MFKQSCCSETFRKPSHEHQVFLLTCWYPWPRPRRRSARQSPASCSRRTACHWDAASGSNRAGSLLLSRCILSGFVPSTCNKKHPLSKAWSCRRWPEKFPASSFFVVSTRIKIRVKKTKIPAARGSGCCITPTRAWNTQIYVVGKGWGLLCTRADHATALQGSFKHRQLGRCSQKRVSLQYTQHHPSKGGSLSRRWELGLLLGMEQGWSEHSFPLRTTEDLTSGGFWYRRDIFVQFLRHTDRPQGLGREPAMLWKHTSHEKLHKSSPFWASRRLSASLSLTLKQNSLVAFFPPRPHLSLDVYRRLNCSSQRKNPLLMTNGKLLTYEGVKQKKKESKAALNQSSQQETINQDELLHHQQRRYSFPFRNHFACLPPPVVTSPAKCGGCVRGLQRRAGDLQQEEWNFLFWSHLKLRR